jgi:BirA family transcriptional regulator, biotin operon repressor / biotin---[acetyl-CoA-carboxylase] ligase
MEPWTVPPGWTLQLLPSTTSTQDDARRAALGGCPDRTVIVADRQTAGRGRLNRSWVSAPGVSLLCSLVLRREASPIFVTATCSVAVAEAIERETRLPARIKWPNDVMVNDRKVCGILTEAILHGTAGIAIVGIGVNVNGEPADLGIPTTGTSLSAAAGHPVSRVQLFDKILQRIDQHLAGDQSLLGDRIRPFWEGRLWRRRQSVTISADGTAMEGVVEGISSEGALRVRRPDGQAIEIVVGELLL